MSADVGVDLSDRRHEVLQRLGEGPTAGTALQESSSDGRSRLNNFTMNQVLPTGTFFKGGTYGTDVNFDVSNAELTNPQFTACIDRNA